MEEPFIYEAKEQTLIIHLPKELDHHNCRNLKYETDLLLAENIYYPAGNSIFRIPALWTAPGSGSF